MDRHTRIAKLSSPSGLKASIITLVVVFVIFGILMVYDVSVVESMITFGDKLFYARQQLLWAGIAAVGMLVAAKIPTRWLIALSSLAFIGSLALMFAVLIPHVGVSVNGARRWIPIGPMVLQPSEPMKLSLILYLSVWLQKPRRFLSFILLIGMLFTLVMLEPDLGTGLILIVIACSMYFISGKPLKHFIWLGTAGLAGLLLLVAIAPYRLDRIKTFLDPESDPLGKSYHIRQITIALGNGGLLGQGLGKSKQKYRYIPEATTDSIFAVIAEELGFVGCGIIIIGYIVLLTRMGTWVSLIKDKTGFYIGVGIVSWFCAQILVNLGSVVALIPLTGVPLLFLSYGGSALASQLVGIGVLLGLGREKEAKK